MTKRNTQQFTPFFINNFLPLALLFMPEQRSPFISICIPAYKRTHYLRRLLQSIADQTFKDFEVILSDDSNDNSVELIAAEFGDQFTIQYYHNKPSLGTPANWNYAISKASGQWIKLMHDDDWFAAETSLQAFAEATKKGSKFIVSSYNNIDDSGKILYKPSLSSLRRYLIIRTPMVLLSENYVGQPSVVMVHHSIAAKYDERMKWRVDIDYYMQLLTTEKSFYFIPDSLINLGISSSQVTHSCLNVPGVELPEGLLLLQKQGVESLKNILVYDAWWRIIRNTGTRTKSDLYQYASSWPKVIENIVEDQRHIKSSFLKKGFLSKLYMTISYLKIITGITSL